MKKITILLIAGIALLTACVTRNPTYKPDEPTSATNPQYIPDTNKIHKAGSYVEMANDATAGIDPYAGMVKAAIPPIEGIATVASLLLASVFNRRAKRKDKALRAVVRADTTEQAVRNAPDVASEIMEHHVPG